MINTKERSTSIIFHTRIQIPNFEKNTINIRK